MRDNTDFWCCDELKEFLQREGFTVREYMEIEDAKFCHKCGVNLSRLV